ncbi:MAG: hypothetical protein ACRC8S_11920 [Fimbriiglobus sp.]
MPKLPIILILAYCAMIPALVHCIMVYRARSLSVSSFEYSAIPAYLILVSSIEGLFYVTNHPRSGVCFSGSFYIIMTLSFFLTSVGLLSARFLFYLWQTFDTQSFAATMLRRQKEDPE